MQFSDTNSYIKAYSMFSLGTNSPQGDIKKENSELSVLFVKKFTSKPLSSGSIVKKINKKKSIKW